MSSSVRLSAEVALLSFLAPVIIPVSLSFYAFGFFSAIMRGYISKLRSGEPMPPVLLLIASSFLATPWLIGLYFWGVFG